MIMCISFLCCDHVTMATPEKHSDLHEHRCPLRLFRAVISGKAFPEMVHTWYYFLDLVVNFVSKYGGVLSHNGWILTCTWCICIYIYEGTMSGTLS